MKTKALIIFCAGFLLSAADSLAGSQPEREMTLRQQGTEKFVYVTGSHIPQKVTVRSIGTTTPYNLRVYTERELQSTGRSTPGEALIALDPSLQLSRGR